MRRQPNSASAKPTVLFFGTYDRDRHPRVQVLKEGFESLGCCHVLECNSPLRLDTAARVQVLRRPWLAPFLVLRILAAWTRLVVSGIRQRDVDLVVVGYLGHFDIHLARILWPRTPRMLDHLISLADTAADRGEGGAFRTRLLGAIDHAAVTAADVPLIDTEAHRALLPDGSRKAAVVVPVGSPVAWFSPPTLAAARTVEVVFFGLFTPLQGTPVIADCIADLRSEDQVRFTMIGSGQDWAEARSRAGESANVRWIPWLGSADLRSEVAHSDICLGIFGTGPKALRVVPNKVFQGAAAGCAIITSDTPPQRDLLGDQAIFVPPGDSKALADALRELSSDRKRLEDLRRATWRHAEDHFSPAAVVAPLWDELITRGMLTDQP